MTNNLLFNQIYIMKQTILFSFPERKAHLIAPSLLTILISSLNMVSEVSHLLSIADIHNLFVYYDEKLADGFNPKLWTYTAQLMIELDKVNRRVGTKARRCRFAL